MKKAGFVAVSPFEIGDRIQCGEKQAVITDILAIHSIKTGRVSFQYEFDNSGKHQQISGQFRRAGNLFIPVV
jgi:hypothetical protein|nr:MAG TPA: Mechanosensitive ion channel [Caudoviricetes sp.]DAX71050.1 MAG TPA: Mechanosensitive ion channel [Caudoviricetes sp.]